MSPLVRLQRRIPDLLRETAFRRYWSGQTISMFGDQVTSIALPLVAVLALRASPSEMGVLTALVWLPTLFFGLHAGAWVDRRGSRRQIMIAADLGRAVLLTSIPVCYLLGVLTLWQLYAVAFGAGTLSVFFVVSDPSLFVALVPQDRYVSGQSLVYGSRAFSFMSGPSVGGILAQLLSAPGAIFADALSFLGSAFFLSRIRPQELPAARSEKGSLTAGAKFIRNSPIVRASLLAGSIVNFFSFVFITLVVLYAIRYLHVQAGVLGVVLGIGAVGGLIGAAITKRIADKIGAGRVYTLGMLLFIAPLALVPAAAGPHWVILLMLVGAEFGCGFGVMMLDITIGAIFAVVIPHELRSRVSGAFQAVNYGTRPLGAAAGGLLGTFIGPRATLFTAVIGGSFAALTLLPGPLPKFKMPQSGRVADADPSSSEVASRLAA